MKKRVLSLFLAALFILPACVADNAETVFSDVSADAAKPNPSTEPVPEETETKIVITIGEREFTAALADTDAAREFAQMLPMTIDMSELNGNEKYYYMDKSLPAAAQRPDKINSGDIMLYGSSCWVLFYESFSTSYSYTALGHIDDPAGLAEIVGNDSVTVTIAIDT